ncbi:ABC transporter ATP-binding protein [Sharpea azabuensis]|uniref:ABC transporter ATP-binding protein n=1 Tax=Sharpea azabuensis TaxID=322505 RepID=UPI002409BEBF|nr:ABC transporter ATP-binding protein [Sharpea azabuensis]MDD6513223.1 ABC transporter ATP-binding protein [Sharpea azabuensis]
MKAIEYINVSKQFSHSSQLSVNGFNAQIEEGEFITILGSSGCGKTTLLKMTNRLYEPTAGKILLYGEDIGYLDPIHMRRNMGYVIQQVGLFPHMTIAKNVSLMLELMKKNEKEIQQRVKALLTLVGLNYSDVATKYPDQLSGGQQQRVGLARALANNPRIMLLDEPFGAIDAITRLHLQNELKRIHENSRKTFLFVTHDINEAFKLGNRVMIMNEGRLLQFDTPQNIVKHPVDDFVKMLIDSARHKETFWESVK